MINKCSCHGDYAMRPYQQENNQWNGSQSEQILWYGEPQQLYQPYPPQNTMPVYTQSGQYQQPGLYQQPGYPYWNPNAGFSNQPFAVPFQDQAPIPQYTKPRPAARMPKAQAQALASNLKKVVLVSSLAAFGVISALVAGNLQSTSASSAPGQNQITDPSQSNSDSGNYFNQGGGGYGFGNDGSGQNPSTSTRSS
jgi:hypothetical protein